MKKSSLFVAVARPSRTTSEGRGEKKQRTASPSLTLQPKDVRLFPFFRLLSSFLYLARGRMTEGLITQVDKARNLGVRKRMDTSANVRGQRSISNTLLTEREHKTLHRRSLRLSLSSSFSFSFPLSLLSFSLTLSFPFNSIFSSHLPFLSLSRYFLFFFFARNALWAAEGRKGPPQIHSSSSSSLLIAFPPASKRDSSLSSSR